MGQAKLENKKRIGILGGTFDPAHKGHVEISKSAKKKFKLNKVIWAVTKKNPFKTKSSLSLKKRISYAKKINLKNKFITIGFYENKIKSNKTVNLLKFFLKKNKNAQIYFIMGADNLINFHKWEKYNLITKLCKILVFDRDGYKSKSIKSLSYKKYNKKCLEFIKFKKVNISSSQLRKI
tara:strand:+ start:1693 stop:2229 length:537 start_codon:yes stop_codon:yes gene_type:complete